LKNTPPELSIIIPCYNEEGNLPFLINKCIQIAAEFPAVEIVLVNNGSTDKSENVFKQLLTDNIVNISVCNIKVNQGYGYGIIEGINKATADLLCWTHADLQTDIFDCLKAFNIFKQYDNPFLLVKGRRNSRPLIDRIITSCMSLYVLFKLSEFIPDINAQPKLFSRLFYNKIAKDAPIDFSLDLFFLIHAKRKGKLIEFPVDFLNRTSGEAKGGGSNKLSVKIKVAKKTIDFINQSAKKISKKYT
jgi:glycosyltransferase involved in cell wall biosynthesis